MLFAVIAWFGLSIVMLLAVLFAAAQPTPKFNSQHTSDRSAELDCPADSWPPVTAAHPTQA
jgi:hypothetical protein